ncbi:WD40 repeat-like protein, partial [Caulochytrium protostelioides]
MAPTAPTVTLTRQVVSDFQIAKIFNENGKRPINAIDFDATGELCVTTADDDTIRLYDCQTGTEKKTLYSKKYGCSLGRFTHHSSHILHAAAKDHIIRYLSLHDNQYLRYFKGHAGRVVNLEMSSQDDTFISSAMDSTVRLWDLRTNHCQGLIHTAPGARTSVGFDHTGLVFATGDSRVVRMFDARNYESGPFA